MSRVQLSSCRLVSLSACALAFAIALSTPRAALADDVPPEKAKATELAKQGAELARTGQFTEAVSKFQESLATFPLVDVYYNLAYCYEQLGDWKGCTDSYEKYLEAYRKDHKGADPPEITSVKRSMEKCKETAQPDITVTSEPPGAQVSLGSRDKVIGTTPVTIKVDPGTYELFISKADYGPVETKIVVLPKQPGKFHFDLRKVAKVGKVRITVNVREATIYINGKNYGISPYLETPELEVGRHQIVVKKERYKSVNETFEVKLDQTTELKYQIFLVDPPPSWRSYIGWTGISVGLVCIAGGIVAYKFADNEFQGTDNFTKYKLLQDLGYGLGGGLLGLGIGLVIWEAFADRVDKTDLVTDGGDVLPPQMPFNVGVTPTRGGAFVSGEVRF